MNLLERAVSPTPTFFQKLRNIGLALAADQCRDHRLTRCPARHRCYDCRLSRCCRNRAECSESDHCSGRQVIRTYGIIRPRLCKRRRGFFSCKRLT